MSALPEISRVAASNSPLAVRFLNPLISLVASTTIAFPPVTVPAVTPSKRVSLAAPPDCNEVTDVSRESISVALISILV